MDINFEDYDDDIGMNEDIVVAKDVVPKEDEVQVLIINDGCICGYG